MENLESIEKAVDKILSGVALQLETLKEVKLLLSSEALKGINTNTNFVFQNLKVPIKTTSGYNMNLYKNYPFDESFAKKMEFLDNIHAQVWRLKERRELIVAIEGSERAEKTLDGVTGKLQNLWKSRKYDGVKYGSVNKFTFYAKKEWITEDGKAIKKEFAPPDELLAQLNEEQRKPENIKWLRN